MLYPTHTLSPRKFLKRSSLLLCLAALSSASAATITWTGAVSSDWTNTANWNPAQVPTSADTVVINSGSVTFIPSSAFSVLTFNGGNIFGPVRVPTNTTFNWNGGRMDIGSSLLVQSNAVLNLLSGAEKDLGGPMTNFGQVNLSGANFYVINDNGNWRGVITNLGVWDMQADVAVYNYFGSGGQFLQNRGTFRKSAGTGTGVIGLPFDNTQGIIDCESGTLRFDAGGQLNGTLIAGAAGTFAFNGGVFAYFSANPFTGPGQYQFTGGTLQGLNDYLPNLQLLGGTVNLAPNYQTNGVILRLDLNGATLGGTSNKVVGVLNAVNGSINGLLEVAANATANLNGTYLYGATTVRSNATMNWYAGRFAQGSSLLIENGAVLNMAGGGERDIGGPMSNYGRVVMSGGSFYVITDNNTWLGNVLNAGAWELQGDLPVGQYFGNDLATFVNAGFFRKTAGTGAASIGLPFFNSNGTLDVWTGAIRFDHGEQLDGLFIAEPGGAVQFNNGTFTYTSKTIFAGNGSFQLTGGTLTGLPDALPNLLLLGGTVILSPTFQTNGSIARLDLNGATLAGSYQVSGVLNLNSGYIAGPLIVSSNGVLNWNSGRFAQGSTLLVNSNAVVNLLTGGEKDLGGPLTNYGALTWTSGSLYVMNDGATWLGTIQNFGMWDTQGDLPINRWFGNDYPILRNSGTLRKSAGTGTATFDIVALNSGAIEPLSGVLSFTRGLSCTAGRLTFGLDSSSYGQISVTGTASINSGIGARLLNGFIPAVGQNFSVLGASTVAGTFSNTNGLNVGFGRVLVPLYTPTTVTLQAAATNGVNNPPNWSPVPSFNIVEGQFWSYTNQVTDPDGNLVLFQLLSAPTGASVGLTNGIVSWTPTEAQGGSTYGFSLRIYDNGNPSLGSTQNFNVTVTKTNTAPVLAVIQPQLIGVNSTLTVTNAATDSDLPGQTLSYSLISPPSGMNVDANGVITWTPTTPGSYLVSMRVADNGTPSLSATNSFTVGVIARPTPPAGLISWWTGDGTTADQNGINNGALSGSANYAPGLFGQAFNFTGGYLTVLDSPSLDITPGSTMTVEMWVKRTQAGPVPYYFGKRVSCGSYNYQSPSDIFAGGSAYDLPVGQWTHFAWVYTGTELLGYVNGALVYHTEMAVGPTNSAAFFLGASGTCNQNFFGLIDEARIYNRALTAAEVQTVYSGQSIGAPVLTQQPSGQMVASGSTLVLNASATGATPLTYQWWYNGAPLNGRTLSSLTLNAITVAQSGTYSVVASNTVGTAASVLAQITVLDAPVITLQPVSQPGGVGGSVTFTTVASGSAPLTYTWRKNGVPISSSLSPSLTLNNLQTTDSGNYDVVVNNYVGSTTSQVAVLTVNAPIVWTGAVSSEWTNSANWNPAQVPTSVDTAVINSGSVQLRTNSQFFALSFNGGNLFGPIIVQSNCVMNWNGGRLDVGSSLLVQSNAVVNLLTSVEKDLGGPMTNFGRVNLSGPNFYVINDNGNWRGSVTNLGLWDLQADVAINAYFGGGGAVFGNRGTFRKSAGTSTGVMGLPFYNGQGVCDSESGTLRFDAGAQLDGTFLAGATGAIVFNSGLFTYVGSNHLTGPGPYQLVGSATLQGLDDYLPNLQLLGGTVLLAPNFQTNGVIVRLDLNGASLGGTSNKVTGVLNANNGNIYGTLETGPNAVLNINGTYLNGPTALRSGATMNWFAGRFAQGSSLLIENGALLNMLGTGERDMGGPMNNYGRVVMTGGPFYVITDNNTWLGSVNNVGLFELAGDASIASYFGNDLALFSNGGILRKSGGTGVSSFNMPLFNSFGSVEVWSGVFRFDHGQQLDGLYVVQGGAALQLNSGTFTYTPPGRFTGNGVYQLVGGTLSGLADYLPNWQFLGGTFTLSPTYQTNGTIARLDLNGATLVGSNQVSGVFNFNGGYIAGSLTLNSNAVLNWNSGRFAQGSSLLVNSNAVVNVLTGGEKDLGGPLTNFGTFTWSSGPLYILNDGGTWLGTIQNFGLWDTQGDLPVNRWFGNDYPVFQNSGVLRKSSGGGNFNCDVICTNRGTVDVSGGIITFSRGLESTAGTLTFGLSNNAAYGQINAAGTAIIAGAIKARLQDGFVPDVGQNFQILGAGSVSGTFNDTNGLTVGFGRLFNLSYAANAVTLQTAGTNGVNNPPVWAPVPNFNIAEGQTLLYTNQVTDPNGDQVLFKLLSAPSGATLGLTNGILNWTPTEAQGNSSNYFIARVFDSGNPSLFVTQGFYVLVSETNTAPVLPVILPQLVGVGGTLIVTNTATDIDLPANTMTYSLLAAPGGVSVDANGIISWTPSTPGSYQVTMRVVDNGIPPLSATNTFNVGVLAPTTPPAGLVSWWTGDGTTGDRSGPNDGALSGQANYGPGLFGQAFNLSGGYLTVPDSASLDFAPGTPLTMEMWVKRTQPGPVPFFFGKRVGCSSYNYESPSDLIAGQGWNLPVGQWQHVAWVFTGTDMLAYVNGALVYRTEFPVGVPNAVPLLIGASGTCGQNFIGLIDEVRLYNRALTTAEIGTVYSGQNLGAPVLTQAPVTQRAISGTTVVMSAAATGAAPLTYQWNYNGAPLAGRTSTSLTLTGVTTAQSGNYTITVSNALGTVTSDVAGLTVIDPPVITLDPQSQVSVVGGTATFTVAANGTPTPVLTYQWRKGGVSMAGQTSTVLTLNNLQVSDSGNYDVIVANWGGSATSHVASLLVSTPIIWTGAASSDWTNPANWNPQQVPTINDTALINSGNVNFATNSQFLALTVNGGNLSGPVTVQTNCALYWNAGNLTPGGSLTVLSNGILYLTSSNQKNLQGPMTNFGQVLFSGGSLYVFNDNTSTWPGSITNLGSWDMQNDLTLAQAFGNNFATFGNKGVFRKSGGSGVGVISMPFINTQGSNDVRSGTLRYDAGGRLGGSYFAGTGAAIAFNGGSFTYVPPTRFSGPGQFQLTGGTLTGLDDYVPNFQLLGGTVNLAPNYQTNGTIVRLDLNGATLGGTSNRVTGVLNATNGSISGLLEIAPTGSANLNGTYLFGFTALRGTAVMNWSAGRFAQGSSLLLESSAILNMLTANEKDLGGPMTNFGRVNMLGGNFYVINDNATWQGRITNRGTWDMQGDFSVSEYFGNGLAGFGNGATFRKSAGTGIGVVAIAFYNTQGTVDAESGTLRFDRGMRLDGNFIAASGAAIAFNSGVFTYVPPSHFTGPGFYQLTGGTLQGLDNYLPNLQLLGGTVFLSPTYQTNGPIVRLDMNGASLGGANQVIGQLNATNGGINGPLEIWSNAVVNLNNTWVYAPVIVHTNGTLNWAGGRFAPGSSLLIEKGALANLLAPDKELSGPMTNYGRVAWTGGSFYLINNAADYVGMVTNAGLWEMLADVSMGQYFNNDLALFQNAGLFRKTAGAGISYISLPYNNGPGTNEVASGILRFDHGMTLNGRIIADAGGIMQFNTGTFIYNALTHLTGAGLFQLTGGTLQGLNDYIPNLQLLGGTVSLSPNYQGSGLINQLDLSGSTLLGSNRVKGVVNLYSGSVAGQLTISSNAVLNWQSGQSGPGSSIVIETNGLLNLTTANGKLIGGLLSNNGQVEWSGGTITLFNDGVAWSGAILNAGLWEIQGDFSMNQYIVNNNASFQNNGILRKAAGTGTATLDVVFYNQGTVEQLSGASTFGRNFSLTAGTVLFGISGDNTFGQINLAGTASLAGRLAARLINGYVPNVGRNFQVMNYGVVAGTFTDYSGLDVGSGRAFAPIYSANALTLQAYSTNSVTAPIVLLQPATNANQFTFLFTGNPGTTYTVEYSTNLNVGWNIMLVTNIPISPALVIDTNAPIRNRFYRVYRAP